jgi:hypothetical protein
MKTSRKQRRWVLMATAISLLMCLSCGALFGAFQIIGFSALPPSYLTQVCVGAQAQPFKVGLWWALPYISALPPHYVPSNVCAWVLWLPVFPPIGGFGFPP